MSYFLLARGDMGDTGGPGEGRITPHIGCPPTNCHLPTRNPPKPYFLCPLPIKFAKTLGRSGTKTDANDTPERSKC